MQSKPEAFEYSTFAMPLFNESYIRWQGDALLYHDELQDKEFHPSELDWNAFWSAMDEANAWAWTGEYEDPLALDGTQWSFTVSYNGKRMTCSGCNSYPEEFQTVRIAIRNLVGGELI